MRLQDGVDVAAPAERVVTEPGSTDSRRRERHQTVLAFCDLALQSALALDPTDESA